MPNHIVNRITADFNLEKFIGKAGDRKTFDFNQFIPMPKCLVRDGCPMNVEMIAEITLGLIDLGAPKQMPSNPMEDMGAAVSAMHQGNAIRLLQESKMAKDLSDEHFELLIAMIRSYRECGSLNWHDWSHKNWGTKWNAYDVEVVSPSVVTFQTAWDNPRPVIDVLATAIGSLKHEWADEDWGNNVGWVEYKGGEIVSGENLGGTPAGLALAYELHNVDPNDLDDDE